MATNLLVILSTALATARDVIRLIAGYGIEGDAHAGAPVQHRYIMKRHALLSNLRQVHLTERVVRGLGWRGLRGFSRSAWREHRHAGHQLAQPSPRHAASLGATAEIQLTVRAAWLH